MRTRRCAAFGQAPGVSTANEAPDPMVMGEGKLTVGALITNPEADDRTSHAMVQAARETTKEHLTAGEVTRIGQDGVEVQLGGGRPI